MENQQPAGEAQNSQKKEWYTNWWGVLIAILLLPYFLLYLMWAKTNWNKWVKIVLTFLVVIATFGAMSDDKNNQQAAKTDEQKTVATEAKSETPAQAQPAIKFSFDIPTLIGKNIDEVTKTLGKPSESSEPTTKQQAVGIDEGNKSFTKDDNTLLVTYKVKSKVIVDFFIDGSDKNKQLAIGNLQENNDKYNVEFVKNVTNPNEILGVKISQKLSADLDANVTYNALAFKIENNENYDWTNCKFELNGGGKIFSGGYEYKSTSGIKAKDSLIISYSDFTKDSQRFNFYSEKPENLFMACDTNGQHRTNYFAIK